MMEKGKENDEPFARTNRYRLAREQKARREVTAVTVGDSDGLWTLAERRSKARPGSPRGFTAGPP
jgi:hypothetical protein